LFFYQDGDEMNLHALQTYESRADAMNLMSVAQNIITPQSNKPVMGIVQDSLLSSYMMTSPGVVLDKSEMCNICMWVQDAILPEPELNGCLWTGLQCFSLLFPSDFNWKDVIVNGVCIKGPFGKKALGRSHGSIIHCLYNDYSPDRTCQFINELQRINHIWFASQGFSIGIGDMRITDKTARMVREECADVDRDVLLLRDTHGKDAEPKINRMLNQTRDSMGLIAQNAMLDTNSLGLMVKSGSKGSMVNILQIMACVGQQNCSGKRMQATLNGRSLPMFKATDISARSKGFVKHSYIDGLTPDEYWHHTVGGREGLIDTAVKTSVTGYIQRRLVKSLESLVVTNDGTVRDSQQRVIQFKYGEDGIDAMHHEMVDCYFDENDLSDYDLNKWPELEEAYLMWKWNQKFQLGEQWAVSVPAGRIVAEYRDGGTTSDVRPIVQPLLDAVKGIELTHAYVLSVFAIETLACSTKALQKIVDILLKKWHRSIVAPGEMVGTIAAQSVGEPTMQSKFFFRHLTLCYSLTNLFSFFCSHSDSQYVP
jgi:DNA-directed RNA polymerase II subunit RPB1